MATEHTMETWEECEQKIALIESRYRPVWFRGHSNSSWRLLSTLERRSQGMSISSYYRLVRQISPEIEAFAGMRLDVPDLEKVDCLSGDYDRLRELLSIGYRSMAYLRHHGFPSPLLDWTASPYVAAYFAFAEAINGHAAIYVYVESPKNVKITASDKPRISTLGPIVQTHARHFRQQSRYTVCTKFNLQPQSSWAFAPHQAVFESPDSSEQDFLWKISIPASERVKVLAKLDRYNLNAYSLFGSEESLMETLAFRHLDQEISPRGFAIAH